MNELIDIVDKYGKLTGQTALKSKIHSEGHYHNTAHIWFYTKHGEILLAQRAASKAICPLLWDVSVAGHVDSGETVAQAAIRETKEELGISISEDQLNKIGVFDCFQTYTNGIIDNEFHHTFISELHAELSTIQFDVEEVENIKLISISEFRKFLEFTEENNNHLIATNGTYYKFVLEHITEAIKN